jgi:hypothetical protein
MGYVYCLDRGGEMSTALKLAKANSRPPVAVPVRAVDGCLSLTVAAGSLRLLLLTIRRVGAWGLPTPHAQKSVTRPADVLRADRRSDASLRFAESKPSIERGGQWVENDVHMNR